jgi:hypothetical protein
MNRIENINQTKGGGGTGVIRFVLALCISISIGLIYYVNIIKKDYVVFTNPDGPNLNESLE